MILILSKQNSETSTEAVMDWLSFLRGDFKRLNGTSFVENFLLDKGLSLSLSNLNIPLNKVKVVWNRRWLDEDYIHSIIEKGEFSLKNALEIHMNLAREINILSKYFFHTLSKKKWLSTPKEIGFNKLEVLEAAVQSGLKTPETIITTSKLELVQFKKIHNRIISKCISDPAIFFSGLETENFVGYLTKTIEVDDNIIDELETSFFPSLFQKLVIKNYEIRSFYLDGKFYSMAIFSQLNEETMIDFRNYDTVQPIRYIPYKLPLDIEKKLLRLVDHFNYTTGSIDIIKSIEGDYVFLEFNPVGQFGMTSKPCNYYLEKKIAEYLIKKDV